MEPRGFTVADFAASYRSGDRVTDVIRATLALLRDAPTGVLIGEPLVERAMADAARLDALDEATAETMSLFGVPFVVKDNIDVAGVATTAGCPGFSFDAAHDATVVALLREQGAIVVGKANLDQFATGLVGTRSPYGVPPNALDPTLVPGGSSSGSAVAVALGLVPFSLGTDTAGSGRVPAALNGIVGIKPTVGAASTTGIVPAVRRLDCPSVFARTVADASAVAAVICAGAGDASTRTPHAPRTFGPHPVVGVPVEWPAGVGMSEAMIAWFDAAVDRLRSLGCEIVPVDVSTLLTVGGMLYGGPLVAERGAAVGAAIDKGIDGLDPTVAAIISRGQGFTAIDAYRTEYQLTRFRAAAAPLWDRVDVIALPTTAATCTLDDVAADPFAPNETMGRLTTFVNLLDLASIVVPITTDGTAVPAGLQLVGAAWQDTELARLATGFETGTTPDPTPACTIVVVGAHLTGMPLNRQLTDRRATLLRTTSTAPVYRLHALAGTIPPKPGLVRVAEGGGSIAVELWSIGTAEFGSFVAAIPAPLCIGSVELADGTVHKGFLCEPYGLVDAVDITDFGGWRSYVARDAGA
ncbi:MAG: allophanate hydrolase [Ilumatobacteraceae bacterium]|nr:allophanate hydrolase [Ilumatobacteraceae bacterium]